MVQSNKMRRLSEQHENVRVEANGSTAEMGSVRGDVSTINSWLCRPALVAMVETTNSGMKMIVRHPATAQIWSPVSFGFVSRLPCVAPAAAGYAYTSLWAVTASEEAPWRYWERRAYQC
jgi:hypothetical protein